MIHWLAVLQFPFLLLSQLLIGLAVYGSDFGQTSGKVYLLNFFLMALLGFLYANGWFSRFFQALLRPLQLVGLLAGVYAYSAFHLAYWDEHSTQQAVLLLLLGQASALTALSSLPLIKQNMNQLALAFVVLALSYIGNYFYPLIGFFLVCLMILADLLQPVKESRSLQHSINRIPLFFSLLLWLLFFEAFTPIWDYQETTTWAFHFSLFFIAVAIGLFLPVFTRLLYLILLVFAWVLLSVLFPSWVIYLSHALVFGLLVGISWRFLLDKGVPIQSILLSSGSTWFWAGFLSFGFYQNLTKLEYRLVFIPLLLLLLWLHYRRFSGSAIFSIK